MGEIFLIENAFKEYEFVYFRAFVLDLYTHKYMKDEIINQLFETAVSYGLCEDFKEKFKSDSSIKNLSDLYKRGFDFVLEHDYPSLPFMEEHLKGKFRDYEIYISEKFEEKNPKEVILNGSSNGFVECNGHYSVVRVRHTSKVDIKCVNYAKMMVLLYDDGEVNIVEKSDNAKISVIQRGGKVNTNGYETKIITPKKID